MTTQTWKPIVWTCALLVFSMARGSAAQTDTVGAQAQPLPSARP
jgi:hypothetical protein